MRFGEADSVSGTCDTDGSECDISHDRQSSV